MKPAPPRSQVIVQLTEPDANLCAISALDAVEQGY